VPAAVEAAPRQFAVLAQRMGGNEVVVAWGQDFGDGTLMQLRVPGCSAHLVAATRSGRVIACLDRTDKGGLLTLEE
jgi:hypothetical protein